MSDQNVPVTIVGTGHGHINHDTIAVTPGAQANIAVSVITPLVAVVVRFGHTFGMSLVGLITAGLTPLGQDVLIPYPDFWALVVGCSKLAASGAALGAIKDIVTIFARLENKFPLLTGNV